MKDPKAYTYTNSRLKLPITSTNFMPNGYLTLIMEKMRDTKAKKS